MATCRIEYFHKGSWLPAHKFFDTISKAYENATEAQDVIRGHNEFERAIGVKKTSFRIFNL